MTSPTTTPSTSTATAYAAADRPLTAVLGAVPPDAWDRPSTCEGWTVRDVVRHLVRTQREFLTERGVELGEEPDVDADPAAAWRAHARRVAAALADEAVAEQAYDGFFGPTTVGATLEQVYVWDMVVHRWDVARSVGADPALTDAELDRVEAGADSFGDALYMDGICRPGTESPADADRTTRVLARLGRG
ncbi:TIGR03086 family metal-binding protein [Geodermatophilus poikilotrophus]|uniref:TIGR03086 family protein n=1 Tax=Geodermatophilus poikilotrophus TaxID=1333667 RepID=A0A1H9ZL92_9ACTN|nr:TIGR03086 family metal-binding protein [Geodermatophilus poikilotrophus]SES81565.1 TIGR03086 family protein [Geodermatophilus poikilotrophus]